MVALGWVQGQKLQEQELLHASSENPEDCQHHDQMKSVQKTVITQVKALCQTME